ncbi:MAG TPA: O-methyltransferase [Verrucomicrobiae bacterium]|nr:O-methyltransferase [Verrucomicrobiae bacterium]
MSTGGNLPYQLRPNKAVERLLFVELLNRLDATLGIDSVYEYFGFGGPQMEDFRLLNECFPEMKMLSIEREAQVLKRQRFNGPHTNVRCKLQTSADFVSNFSSKSKAIVWLDYTVPSERPEQVAEFQNLLRHVKELSIIKITLNAAVSTLGGHAGKPGLPAERLKKFMDDFGRCFPNGLGEETVTANNFPKALLQVLEYAAAEVLHDRHDWRFQPLASAVYADGQTMLTLTGIVGKRSKLANVVMSPNLVDWDFTRFVWDNPVAIEVPELTLKERIHVNQLLPKYQNDIPFIHRKLGFQVDKKTEESERKLRNYVSFQKHYPHFGKVAI